MSRYQQQVSSARAEGNRRFLEFLLAFGLCFMPGLELAGFGTGYAPWTFNTALIAATVGGALAGWLLCSRPMVAGLIQFPCCRNSSCGCDTRLVADATHATQRRDWQLAVASDSEKHKKNTA